MAIVSLNEVVYTRTVNGTRYFTVRGNTVVSDSAPTGNCQLYTVGYANNIFAHDNPLQIFRKIQQSIMKNVALIDIKQNYCEKIDNLFKGTSGIISKSPYTSTNGSRMCIYLLRTNVINDLGSRPTLTSAEEEKKNAELKQMYHERALKAAATRRRNEQIAYEEFKRLNNLKSV